MSYVPTPALREFGSPCCSRDRGQLASCSPRRKMGHFTCLDENLDMALAVALATRSALS